MVALLRRDAESIEEKEHGCSPSAIENRRRYDPEVDEPECDIRLKRPTSETA